MSYFHSGEKKDCCGCEACKQICPKGAIIMKPDFEGFLYPQIVEAKCINCNLCRKVCPISNKVDNQMLDERKVFSIHTNDEELLDKSSSGGAFTIITEAYCDKDYVIFGARYDEKFNVYHDYIENIEEIYKFRKSKYVQSNLNNSYKEVLRFLKEDKKVIFSGTPCQIAGLKKFLRKEYENLLCIDIVCHGVPSKKVWNKYLEYIESKYNSKINNINFRHKVKQYGIYNSRNIKILLENGKRIIEDSRKNLYLRGFHNKLFYRHSCTSCKFSNPTRYADITIADCWGIENIDSTIDVHRGESMVVINTQKGMDIWNKINQSSNISKLELDLEFAIKSNEQFREATKVHKNRDDFYKNLDSTAFNKNIKSSLPETFKSKVKRMIPNKIKVQIKNILNY